MKQKFSPYLILVAVMIVWGISWPSTKVGLQDISPMWFTSLRLLGASVVMFAILFFSKKLSMPKKEDLPMIINMGLFQMALIILLVNYALQYLEAGRSALLVDSSVIWVTPIAILFFGEKLTRLKLIGMLLGLSGILILVGPWDESWQDPHTLFGYAMLCCSTFVWAGVLLYLRYGKWHNSPAVLLPWQFLVGAIPVLLLAVIFEPISNLHFTTSANIQLIYNMVFATVFGYWGIATASKQLPSITTSLLLLGIPVVAVASSHLILQEALNKQIIFAFLLVLLGLYCAKQEAS